MLLLLVPCLAALSGCVQRSTPKKSEASKQQTTEVSEELLRSVVSNLQSSFDDAAFTSAVDQLNQYLQRNVGVLAPWRDQDQVRTVALIGPDGANTAKSSQFIAADAVYLKSALFLRAVARDLEQSEPDSLRYAQRLFAWLNQEVDFLPNGWQPNGLPVDVCIRGTGTGNERAWIFLELLRQAGLQGCVVGIPTPGNPEGILPWLCGVLLDNEVYLFEPSLGVPLRPANGTIATLKELVKTPSILESLSATEGPPYPVKPEDVKNVSLLLVVQSQMLAPRMTFLEERLSGALRVNLVLKLDELLGKAKAALEGIDGNQGVRVWQYPQIVASQFNANRGIFFRSVNLAWFRDPNSPRLQQLRGEYEEAIRGYVRIDMENASAQSMNEALAGLPIEVRRNIIGLTPQDVLYFTGVCQLAQDRSQPEVAKDWFRRYLDRFGTFNFRPSAIINPAPLADLLAATSHEPVSSAVARVRSLLSESERQVLRGANLKPLVDLVTTLENKGPEACQPLLTELRSNSQGLHEQVTKLREGKATVADAASKLSDSWEKVLALVEERVQLARTLNEKKPDANGQADPDVQLALSRNQKAIYTAVEKATKAAAEYVSEVLNTLVMKRDFYEAADFAETLKQNSSDGELAALAAASAELTDAQSARLNRLLLSATFPESLEIGRRSWIAASIRMSAILLNREGKTDEAIQRLTEAHPALLPVERAPFIALANQLQSERKSAGVSEAR
jgi:hypothetical protein